MNTLTFEAEPFEIESSEPPENTYQYAKCRAAKESGAEQETAEETDFFLGDWFDPKLQVAQKGVTQKATAVIARQARLGIAPQRLARLHLRQPNHARHDAHRARRRQCRQPLLGTVAAHAHV